MGFVDRTGIPAESIDHTRGSDHRAETSDDRRHAKGFMAKLRAVAGFITLYVSDRCCSERAFHIPFDAEDDITVTPVEPNIAANKASAFPIGLCRFNTGQRAKVRVRVCA